MINGNDGGAYVSTDAGKSWRYLDNIPIEQFYMVASDDNRPYLLCGGLQDNNGWCGPSNSLSRGGIVGADQRAGRQVHLVVDHHEALHVGQAPHRPPG